MLMANGHTGLNQSQGRPPSKKKIIGIRLLFLSYFYSCTSYSGSACGVLDNVPSSSIPYGLNIPISLGKRRSSIEDHGFVAPSISRLKLSKASLRRIDLCSCLPLSSTRVGTNVLIFSRLFLVLDLLDR